MLKKKVIGKVHSIESLGCMDGPGLRTVVFLEGCHLRCAYCCNRDMLDLKDYHSYTPRQLLNEIKQYKLYFGKKGGVTISGGDPVFQPDFVIQFLELCKEEGIHTTLDTSFFTTKEYIDEFVKYTDLFMISLKQFNNAKHIELTGVSNENILKNILYLDEIKRTRKLNFNIWFRYVILPNNTDQEENLIALKEFLKHLNFERIELIPYHKLGVHKWKQLGLDYPLESTPLPTQEKVKEIYKMLSSQGYQVKVNAL